MDRVGHHFAILRDKYAQFFFFLQQAVTVMGRQCQVELAREEAQIMDLIHQHSQLQLQSILNHIQTDLPFQTIIQSFCSLLKATFPPQFKGPIYKVQSNVTSPQNRQFSNPFPSFRENDKKQAISAYILHEERQIRPEMNIIPTQFNEQRIVDWRKETPVQTDCSPENEIEKRKTKFIKNQSHYRPQTPPNGVSPNKFDYKTYKEASECLRRYENLSRGFNSSSRKKADPLGHTRYTPFAFTSPLNK